MVSKEQVSYETRRADRGESNSGAVAGLVHCYVSRSQTDVRRLSVSKELPIKKEKKKEKKIRYPDATVATGVGGYGDCPREGGEGAGAYKQQHRRHHSTKTDNA